LSRGLKFVPTPRSKTAEVLRQEFEDFARIIRLRWFFRNKPDRPFTSLRLPSAWTVPHEHHDSNVEKFLLKSKALLLSSLARSPAHRGCNVSRTHWTLMRQLRDNPDIWIGVADKNLGIVIADRAWYEKEVFRQLDDQGTYRFINQDQVPIAAIKRRICELVKQFPAQINTALQRFIIGGGETIPAFYITIKLHKTPTVGRPIVAGHSWITTNASKWLDFKLQDVVKRLPTVLKDSTHLIKHLESTTFAPGTSLATADITSLYTNIPTEFGIAAVQHIMGDQNYAKTEIDCVLAMLKTVLDNNYFRFQDRFLQQVKGCAMGTPCAPAYANIAVYYLEQQLLKTWYPSIIQGYWRLIDDVFLVLTPNFDTNRLSAFNDLLAGKIIFNFVTSASHIDFLDLTIYKGDRFNKEGRLDIKVYQKPLNAYLYLPFNSFHPRAQMTAFITGELRRYVRNSSDINAYIEIRQLFFQRLRYRGYPWSIICKAAQRIQYKNRSKYLNLAETNTPTSVDKDTPLVFNTTTDTNTSFVSQPTISKNTPLVFKTTYDRSSKHLGLGRHLRHFWNILDPSVFPKPPIICYRRNKTLQQKVCHPNSGTAPPETSSQDRRPSA
jgi:hypothetical protein